MNALSTLIVSEHLIDLQHEAEAARLAARATRQDGVTRRSTVQRLAGRSARGLSRGLAALAARVDPLESTRQPSTDRTARRIAA